MADATLSGPGGSFEAVVELPGDKSLSHRALIFAAIAEGDSLIEGRGTGADVAATERALRLLGVRIDGDQVRSPGVAGWATPAEDLDCANSGTTMRLLAGALSTSRIVAVLTGDASLSSRPMGRLVEPLTSLGGVIATTEGTPPLEVGGAADARPAAIEIDVASAQVRSAAALAALAAEGRSTIDSPPGFRDHTERWLAAIGRGQYVTDTKFEVDGGPIPPARYEIPGDPSSAAYLWACAAIHPGSRITTPRISLNPGRLGFLQILESMGAAIEAEVTGATGGDPVGDVTVSAQPLHGVEISGSLVASALDELPLVAVLGAFAEGITTVADASELRVKESDRIDAVAAMLRALGGGIETADDGFFGRRHGIPRRRFDRQRGRSSSRLGGSHCRDEGRRSRHHYRRRSGGGIVAGLLHGVGGSVVIAIDGPGGVGKSTVARRIADHLGLSYLDTGSTYRAATLIVLREGIDPRDEDAILAAVDNHIIGYGAAGVTVDGEEVADAVRSETVTANTSAVSAHPRVRERIVAMQRQWVAERQGRAVVEGRDIGTVVFPRAPVKVFLTARPDVRAARRAGDAESGAASVQEIREALEARDTADASRTTSPMRPAPDAEIIDTSDIDIDGVVGAVLGLAAMAEASESEEVEGLGR